MNPSDVAPWTADWLWGLPLVILTVIIHSFGLALIDRRASLALDSSQKSRAPSRFSMLIMGATALSVTILHGFEGAIWALAYLLLGAMPDQRAAMLYSLGAMTTYGGSSLPLALHWQLMGTLEALNGWILFGLTTAFLFTVSQKIWPRFSQSGSVRQLE
jgi:hypothetical protein